VAVANDAVVSLLGYINAQPLVVSAQLATSDPDMVQRFVNAWIKALVYIRQDPDDAAQLLQIFLHRQGSAVSREAAQAWLKSTSFGRYGWTADDIADAEYNGWAWHQAQMIPAVPDLDPLVDNSFAERALAKLTGEPSG
jgi:ABC-type nitrate/sulfonate/bicarbonate transport system substrate-binding protein